MASFSVFEPPATQPGSFEAADASAFVKDGFCWPALFVPPVWLIWRRMWLVFLCWLAASVAMSVAAARLGLMDCVVLGIEALFAVWFALEANAFRRWTLTRKGWRFAGIATGVDLVDAEHRFFARARSVALPPARRDVAAAPSAPRPAEPVIGLFPEPWDGARDGRR